MLLRWVLTRDETAVRAMLNVIRIDDGKLQIRPETWDDVAKAYANPDEVRTDDGLIAAILKFEMEVSPATESIYSALGNGKLHNWVQPNGSGDMVRPDPSGWKGRRIFSRNGPDMAVPVDRNQQPR